MPSFAPPPVGPDGRGHRVADAHGHAALLLVESLIHGLITKSVISVAEAVEVIDVAATINVEMADEGRENVVVLAEALGLLEAMSNSLEGDVTHGPDTAA